MLRSSRFTDLVRRLRHTEKERPAVAEVREAHRKAVDSGAWTQPIRTMTFTALACGTNEPEPGRGEIRSIGAVKIRDNRIALGERFYALLCPAESASPSEIAIARGLTRDGESRAMTLPEALERLLAFVGDTVVVGHGAELHVQSLNAALAAQGAGALEAAAVDTRLLHQWSRRSRSLPDLAPGDVRLEDLAVELALPRYLARHAFYDALTTGLAFLKLLGEFEASGAVQFQALYRVAGTY